MKCTFCDRDASDTTVDSPFTPVCGAQRCSTAAVNILLAVADLHPFPRLDAADNATHVRVDRLRQRAARGLSGEAPDTAGWTIFAGG